MFIPNRTLYYLVLAMSVTSCGPKSVSSQEVQSPCASKEYDEAKTAVREAKLAYDSGNIRRGAEIVSGSLDRFYPVYSEAAANDKITNDYIFALTEVQNYLRGEQYEASYSRGAEALSNMIDGFEKLKACRT